MDKKFIPNISLLHEEKDVKEKLKHNIFNIVLNKCVEKIIYTNRHTDQTFVVFEVPNILIGYPSYDRLSCINFLIKELTQKEYKVQFIEPFYLHIDWGHYKRKSNREKNLEKIEKIDPKLKQQTEELLKKFPNTSKIIFEYQNPDEEKRAKKGKNKKKKK